LVPFCNFKKGKEKREELAKLSKHHQSLEDSAESEAARLAEIERVLWDTAKVAGRRLFSFDPPPVS